MRIQLIGLGALLLSACGSGGGDSANEAENQVNAAPVRLDETQQRVTNLSEGERNGVLIRAIRDSGKTCQHVETSIPAEEARTAPVYFATCEDGAVYAVAISAGGRVVVSPVTPAEQKNK
jgi:hypothetical protein